MKNVLKIWSLILVLTTLILSCNKDTTVQYTITTQVVNGTISQGPLSVLNGGSYRVVFQPNVNCILDSVIVNGTQIKDSVSGYTFNNVSANQTIKVIYRSNTETRSALLGSWTSKSLYTLSGLRAQAGVLGFSDTISSKTQNVDFTALPNSVDKIVAKYYGDLLNINDDFYDTFTVSGSSLLISNSRLISLNSTIPIPLDSLVGSIKTTTNTTMSTIATNNNSISLNIGFSWNIIITQSLYKNPPSALLPIIGSIAVYKSFALNLTNGVISEQFTRR
ncbi:MAG: hypothetical protein QM539_05750 [Alphaproteobacteria bacterium]|nr:hypothetical protein [Alphaproteobacteria bacterium]